MREPKLEIRDNARGWIAGLAALAMTLANPAAASAQGCAMCYTTAAAARAAAIQALRHGILILLFPPVLMFGAILVMAYRGRNRFNERGGGESPEDRKMNEWLARLEAVESAEAEGASLSAPSHAAGGPAARP